MPNKLKYAFRITHIDNMAHIIKHGLVRRDSLYRNHDFVPIGDRRVIDKRMAVRPKGLDISRFIPFYLGPRSPMLYVIQHGYNGVQQIAPELIVYCTIRLEDLVKGNIDCIFTDGHALSAITSFYDKQSLSQIDQIVAYDDVYASVWNTSDPDLKRRKEAELLLMTDLPPYMICGYVVYNDWAKQKLLACGVNEKKVVVKPDYYF